MAGRVIASEELARTHLAPDLVRSGNFSPGMKAGPFVFVSGSAASDLSKDIRGQAQEVLEYISGVLEEVDYSMNDIVKVQAFIRIVADYEGYNEVRRRFFTLYPPASTTIVADFLFPGMLIEIEAVAYKEEAAPV